MSRTLFRVKTRSLPGNPDNSLPFVIDVILNELGEIDDQDRDILGMQISEDGTLCLPVKIDHRGKVDFGIGYKSKEDRFAQLDLHDKPITRGRVLRYFGEGVTQQYEVVSLEELLTSA